MGNSKFLLWVGHMRLETTVSSTRFYSNFFNQNMNSAADIEKLSRKLHHLAENTFFLTSSSRTALWGVCDEIELNELLLQLNYRKHEIIK